MTKFLPLDLSSQFNIGREPEGWHPAIGERLSELPAGAQRLWGVPFQFGPADGACWLSPGSGDPLTVPLSADVGRVSYLVFAHLCDESHDPTGQAQPADYAPGDITAAGRAAGRLRAGLRRRQRAPPAHPPPLRDQRSARELGPMGLRRPSPHRMESRPWEGPYPAHTWGRNQRSLSLGPGQACVVYWLYALPNPHPEQPLKAVRLESSGHGRLAVAGITLYDGAAHPLRHRQLESLRVSLARAADARRCRGVGRSGRRRPHLCRARLRSRPLAGGRGAGLGRGAAAARPDSDLRVDVTASADATLLVAGQEVPLEPIYATGKSASADGSVRVELLTPGKTWVHVSVKTRRPAGQPPPASTSARRTAATCRPTATATRSTTTGSRTTAAT